MMICCGMAVKRMGLLDMSVREMKSLPEGDNNNDW
jgi:hypothetical protein